MNQKEEAVRRMKMLGILPNVIREFEQENVLNLSEHMDALFPAVLYWVTNDTYNNEKISLTKEIKEFEEKYNALVYHVQLSHTSFGDLYAFFYVSEDEDEWEDDREWLEKGCPIVYVWNATDPWCSEFGSISIRPAMGGIERVM